MSDTKDREVVVCDACLQASCWHGEFYCSQAKQAGITTRTVAELDAMGLEHPDHYSPKKLKEIYG